MPRHVYKMLIGWATGFGNSHETTAVVVFRPNIKSNSPLRCFNPSSSLSAILSLHSTLPQKMKSPECHSDQLALCDQLFASLSDSIPTVQSFRGRWSAIATKLTRLRSDVADLTTNAEHPLLYDLFKSMVETFTTALALCLHCRDADPPAGKLQTQSEISAVSALLDQHLSDADVLLKSSVLIEENPAEVGVSATDGNSHGGGGVGSGSSSSKREVVRLECGNLVTRLQIGNVGQRSAAMDSLLWLLNEGDKNVLIAVAQGVVPVLVRVLESPTTHEIKEKAVAVIARIAAVESCRCVLIGEGLVLLNHLSRILESGDGIAKEKACFALQALTLSRENSMAVSSRGGVSSLLEICRTGTPTAQATAAGVLKNLAVVEEIRHEFVEERGFETLTQLCSSGTASAQENSIACLRNLAAGDGQNLKLLIFRVFGIETLRNYWDLDDSNLEPAVGLLHHLSTEKPIVDNLVTAGFIPRLISALSTPSSATRTLAAKSLSLLSPIPKSRAEITNSDCIPCLITMLEAKGAEEKDAAAKALSALTIFPENRQVVTKQESGITNLVNLLNPILVDVEKKYPISVLSSLSESKKCRRRMVDAGACGFLKRLTVMEVEGAKKLLDCLEKGTRSLFRKR